MAERRQSNGSIDDDHDFSRRILQVTNPDHR
jgi:cell wall integrity and stress response component